MKRLLILDLDETLIHSEAFKGMDYLDEGTYDFRFSLTSGGWSSGNDYWYFTRKRPFLDEFMKYAFDNFKVAVWTAADRDYASVILEKCDIPTSKLEFFWSKERCTMKIDYDDVHHGFAKSYGEKNLLKVHRTLGWNLENVLIVDDVPKTAVNNYGNLIQIKPFDYQPNDTELLKLMSYLETIKDEPNYRSIDKRGWSSKTK